MNVRFRILLFTFILCISGFSALYAGDVRYVTAGSGLVLRETPSMSGKKIRVLIRNTRVTVLGVSDKEETIEGNRAKWLKVETNGDTGWVFGGFTIGEKEIRVAWVNRISGISGNMTGTESEKIPYRAELAVVSFSQKGDTHAVTVKWHDAIVETDERDLSFIPVPEYIPGFNPDDAGRYRQNLISYHGKLLEFMNGTSDGIINRFGPVVRSETNTRDNPHGGDPITFVTYHFRGIEATYLRGNAGMLYLQSARITSGRSFGNFPVTVGSGIREAFAYFGIPEYDYGTDVIYMTGIGGGSMIGITHEKGLVRAIVITNLAD